MRWLTSSSSGSINGWATISERRTSARTSLAATRSRSEPAAIPASRSPDFSSLALANTSRKSAKTKRSARMVVEYGIGSAHSSCTCFTGNASFHLAAPLFVCLLPNAVPFLFWRLNVPEADIQSQIIRELHPSRQEKREIEESGSQQGAHERWREGAACRSSNGRDPSRGRTLVRCDHGHQVGMAGRDIHLRHAVAQQYHSHRQGQVRHERRQHQKNAGGDVSKHHRVDKSETRRDPCRHQGGK